jgi:protein-S-isoprenylcysteine O-methyltransferase Ste14
MPTLPRKIGPVLLARMVLGALFQPALVALLLFGAADTLAWWRAWVLIGITLVATAGSVVRLARVSPDLLAERFKPPVQRGQPRADRVAVVALLAAFVAAIGFIPVDVFHVRLFPRPAPWGSAIGLALFLTGWWIVTRALAANAFALPVVKAQQDRGQRVVEHGPYAIVRHPMYAGIALVLIGMPLWLESVAGMLAALVPIAILAVRIALEERFLRRELAGYAAYAARVRFRMIPGLW